MLSRRDHAALNRIREKRRVVAAAKQMPLDPARLQAAYDRARADLLAARGPHGHWEGRLASSSLSTATAVSALAIVQREDRSSNVQPLIDAGVKYLAGQQNPDG